jgi:hypothetical protein
MQEIAWNLQVLLFFFVFGKSKAVMQWIFSIACHPSPLLSSTQSVHAILFSEYDKLIVLISWRGGIYILRFTVIVVRHIVRACLHGGRVTLSGGLP